MLLRIVHGTFVAAVLCVSAAVAAEEVEGDWQALLDAYEARQYPRALDLAEAFVAAHPEHAKLADALFLGGSSAGHLRRLAPAAAFYGRLVKEFPKFEHAGLARGELAACYSGLRRFDECIAQSSANLKLEPGSPSVPYWRFLIAQSHFRAWRFTESRPLFEAFLAQHGDSKFAGHARRYLGRIDPPWEIDANGIVPYTGKLAADVRMQAALTELPAKVKAGFAELKKRLGVDLKRRTKVIFLFEDAGDDPRKGLIAETMIVGRGGAPHTVVRFYAEHVVARPVTYARTLVHEMKHAGFKGVMGQAYDDLPSWVREGLALWGADQLENRIGLVLGNAVVSGKDPLTVLDGIDDPRHDLRDYLEDVLAFEWLESRKTGNVKTFCRRLLAGKPYRTVWAELAGTTYEEAIRAADAHCRSRVIAALGDGLPAFTALRDANYAAMRQGAPAVAAWVEGGGASKYEAWLEKHTGHPVAPFARFCLGRALVQAKRYDAGRRWLLRVLKEDGQRTNLLDDAQFWLGYSYHLQGDAPNAKAAFGVLLRDFSFSSSAKKVAGKFPAAGPVTK